MTGAHRHAAVVARRVPEHVEEQAVHLVALQRFGEDGQRVLAVVAAVDAGRVETAVDRRFAAGPLEEPLRVGVEHRLLRLAQIEAPDHAHPARVRGVQRLPEQIAPRRQERARVVKARLASGTARRCRPC